MDRKNELKWGAILSYLQMALSIVVGVVYTPVMIRLLGQSEYGLYNTVASTISMLSILNLGFNSSYVRFFSKYKKENDYEHIYGLNGMFLLIFSIIGSVALACGVFFTTHLQLVFKDGLTEHEYGIARILMLLLTINLAISFPASVFSTIISSNERFILLKLMGIIRTVLGPLVNLPLLLMGIRSIGLVASSLFFSLVTDIVFVFFVFAKLKQKFTLKNVELGLFRSVFTFTLFIAINAIVDQINNNIDRVILGRYRGTISVAVYSVGANLYSYYIQFSTSVSGVFTPRIHAIYNRNVSVVDRNQELTDLFVKVGRIQCLILSLIASGLVAFGKSFISFWAGEGYNESYYVALLLVLPASIPLIQNLGIEIQRAANQHHFRSIIYFFMALINLTLSIVLCQSFGAVGAAFGTSVSLIVANGLIMNIYYHKKIGINIIYFWRNILRLIIGMVPAFCVGAAISLLVDMDALVKLLIWMFIYSVVYLVSIWNFSMNQFEKDIIKQPVLRFVHKAMDKKSK